MKYYMSKNDWYSNWEKDNEDWLEYLARDVSPAQSQVPTTEIPKQNITNEQKSSEINSSDSQTKSEYKQMSFFELYPDGCMKNEVVAKKATPKRTKKTQTSKEIINTATQLEGVWEDLDQVIESLDTEAKNNNNIFIDFHGTKLYSLLDDKNSCYQKVTGLDYESYCRLEPYINEM